jgi:membrane-associated phospholipid phosphatase
MRQFKALKLTCGFLLLQLAIWVHPVLCQDGAESDLNQTESESYSGLSAMEPCPGGEAVGSGPQVTEQFYLFPPKEDKDSKSSLVSRFLSDIWTDQKAIWTSPVRMNRREFFTIALPLAAATAGLIATDSSTSNWLQNSPEQVKWSQRFSAFGAIHMLGLVTGGPMIGGKIIGRPDYVRIGRNATEALVNAIITGYVLKGITGRERPNAGDEAGKFWSGGQSFPSGHAINSWAVAMAIARTPNCPRWFAITSYVMAAAISFSRWSANKHHASDILVGAVFGGLIGNYVVKRPR